MKVHNTIWGISETGLNMSHLIPSSGSDTNRTPPIMWYHNQNMILISVVQFGWGKMLYATSSLSGFSKSQILYNTDLLDKTWKLKEACHICNHCWKKEFFIFFFLHSLVICFAVVRFCRNLIKNIWLHSLDVDLLCPVHRNLLFWWPAKNWIRKSKKCCTFKVTQM